jgi:hypothetical protein
MKIKKIVAAIALAASSLSAQADITDGKFGTGQLFDVQYYWSQAETPTTPDYGCYGTNNCEVLHASGFTRVYSNSGQLSAQDYTTMQSTGQYFGLFNSTTHTGEYGLAIYNSDGTVSRVLHTYGTVSAIGPDAIFYIGSGFNGTVISTTTGYALNSSATFSNMDTSVTTTDLTNYSYTTTTPLAPGETASSTPPSSSPVYVAVTRPTVVSVTPTSTNSPPGETAEYAIDGDPSTKYLNFDRANAGFTIKLQSAQVLQGIKFTTANDFEARDPSKYSLFGSNDGVNWTTIVNAESITLSSSRYTQSSMYSINNTNPYFYYFITFPDIKASAQYSDIVACGLACDSVQIGDVEFIYDSTFVFTAPTDTGTGTIANPGTAGSVSDVPTPVVGPQPVVNASGSTSTNPTGTTVTTVNNAGTYTNDGTTGDVTNTGTFTNNGTTSNVNNAGTFTNNGTVGDVTNTGTFTNSGNTGTFTNSGIFAYNGGTLSGYTQTVGTTVMSISQPIMITGIANLAGGLIMTNVPDGYGRYTVLSAGSVNGTYDDLSSDSNYLKYSLTDVKLYVTPDAAATQASIDATTKNLSNAINLQSSAVTGALGNDCAVFGETGACVSVNVGMSKAASGDLYNSGLTVVKKVNESWRVGVTSNAPLTNPTIGNVSQTSDPAFGVFATWSKDQLSVQGSAAFNQGTMTMTRQGPETGIGKMSVDNKAYQLRASYAIPATETVTVTPYAGIRYVESNYSGYTEQGPVFPLTVNSTTRNQTSVIAGVSVAKQLTENLTGNVSVGVTRNLTGQSATFTGTSEIGGLSTFNTSLPSNGNTNPSVGAGLSYSIDKTTRVGVNVGVQQKGDNANISSIGISITRGF